MKSLSTMAASAPASSSAVVATLTPTTWKSKNRNSSGFGMMMTTTKQFATTTTTLNQNEGDDEDKKDKDKESSSAATATGAVTGAATTSKSAAQQPFKQHSEWVKFQQSITVSGFQTGQTTTATVLKKITRWETGTSKTGTRISLGRTLGRSRSNRWSNSRRR